MHGKTPHENLYNTISALGMPIAGSALVVTVPVHLPALGVE
jgi:hypothetical protein